jgi:hypothetical protein
MRLIDGPGHLCSLRFVLGAGCWVLSWSRAGGESILLSGMYWSLSLVGHREPAANGQRELQWALLHAVHVHVHRGACPPPPPARSSPCCVLCVVGCGCDCGRAAEPLPLPVARADVGCVLCCCCCAVLCSMYIYYIIYAAHLRARSICSINAPHGGAAASVLGRWQILSVLLGWNQYSTGIWSRRRTTKWLSEADSAVRITPARPQRQRELVPVALS